MSKYSISLSFVFVGTLFCFAAIAQQQRVVISLNANNDGQDEFERVLGDLRDSAEFYLAGKMGMLDKVCELSETQKKKLKVASKGAMDKFVKAEYERCKVLLRRYQQQAGFDIEKLEREEQEGEKEEASSDDEDDDDEEEEDERPIRNFAFSLQTAAPTKVEEQPRWKDSLKKVLTEEQVEKAELANAEREKRIEDAAVARFIAKIDLQLFLNEEQREHVRQGIQEEFGGLLVKEIIFEEQFRRPTLRAGQLDGEPEHLKLIEGVLDESQVRQWNRSVEPHLKYLKTLKNRR